MVLSGIGRTHNIMTQAIDTQDANLSEYQAKLDSLIAADSKAIFANYSRAHARCIIRTFLSGAKESADILAGDFGNDFYQHPAIQAAVLKAVTNGAHVRVISLGTSKASKDFVVAIAESASHAPSPPGKQGTFQYKFAQVRQGAKVKHYMIIDGKRYRLEDYHDEGSDSVHAEVCCNGQGKATTLTRTFEAVWNRLPTPSEENEQHS